MWFSNKRDLGCPEIDMEHILKIIIRDIKMCTDFKILKVKVPVIFFGTQGFSSHRDGRYNSLMTFNRRYTPSSKLQPIQPGDYPLLLVRNCKSRLQRYTFVTADHEGIIWSLDAHQLAVISREFVESARRVWDERAKMI